MGQYDGIITQQLKTIHKDAIDALLLDSALTVPCKFVYEGTSFIECSNCLYNTLSKRSSGVYKTGGPIPFIDGQICPYCSGEGLISIENSETINMMVIWSYKHFYNFDIKTQSPDGKIQTMSYMSTTTNIKRASYIIVNTDIQNLSTHKFVRDGEPSPIGWGADNWVLTMWRKE